MSDVQLIHADELRPRIAIIGVGGAGGNAVAHMIAQGVAGVEFIVANTDAQAVGAAYPARAIQLGREVTQGLGAGSVVGVGKAAAEETIEEIAQAIHGSHMCFIAAGMGGGTGTGAAPVIAQAARDKGILTIGVVTKPFAFEGRRRALAAEAGVEELRKHVDTLIVIPNQNLFRIADRETTFREAFSLADDVLQQGVRGITDLMVMPGLVNLDFADIRSVMGDMGHAMMGTGEASGAGRALEATRMAIANPLLDGMIDGARGLIVSITGGDDLALMEIDEAVTRIKELIDPDADIIWGAATSKEMQGRMRVSIIATGLEPVGQKARIETRARAKPVAAPVEAVAPVAAIISEPASEGPMRSYLSEEEKPATAEPLEFALQPEPTAEPEAPAEVDPANAQEELLLAQHNMCPALAEPEFAAAAQAAEMEVQVRRGTLVERGPSLFQRVAAMARAPSQIREDGEGGSGALNYERADDRRNIFQAA